MRDPTGTYTDTACPPRRSRRSVTCGYGITNIHAGRLLAFEKVDWGVKVTWRARGAHAAQSLVVDHVVNCTGPDYNARRSRDPLMRALLAQGLATTDSLRLGLRTGACGALLDSRGRAASNLFYIGPMLRADFWEATAAQELRGHAERLAGLLAAPTGAIQSVGAL